MRGLQLMCVSPLPYIKLPFNSGYFCADSAGGGTEQPAGFMNRLMFFSHTGRWLLCPGRGPGDLPNKGSLCLGSLQRYAALGRRNLSLPGGLCSPGGATLKCAHVVRVCEQG